MISSSKFRQFEKPEITVLGHISFFSFLFFYIIKIIFFTLDFQMEYCVSDSVYLTFVKWFASSPPR